MKLLVATRSEHKLREIRGILAGVPDLDVVGLEEAGVAYDPREEDLEPFETFEENALSKARYFHDRTGMVTVADDSGLCVDALEGRPGVHSKRFAPGDATGLARDLANNAHLLASLTDVPRDERGARYVCVVALVDEGPEPRFVRGEVEGVIASGPRGEGGFGYDPLFLIPEWGRTFGESTPEEKHAVSHRGRAFRALAGMLEARRG